MQLYVIEKDAIEKQIFEDQVNKIWAENQKTKLEIR
jgi:hypothetical protein